MDDPDRQDNVPRVIVHGVTWGVAGGVLFMLAVIGLDLIFAAEGGAVVKAIGVGVTLTGVAVGAAMGVDYATRKKRRARRRAKRRCVRCGSALTGSESGRCPECGTLT